LRVKKKKRLIVSESQEDEEDDDLGAREAREEALQAGPLEGGFI